MIVVGVLIDSGPIPYSFLICSSLLWRYPRGELWRCRVRERSAKWPNRDAHIAGVGLWAYAANKKETKERRYPESKFQRGPCSKASRVAAARWGENFSGSWSVTSRNPLDTQRRNERYLVGAFRPQNGATMPLWDACGCARWDACYAELPRITLLSTWVNRLWQGHSFSAARFYANGQALR
jgi:hypothetical protein